ELYFFFLSSRRRHTRSKRDWSSDVCSSDLSSVLPVIKEEYVKLTGSTEEAIILNQFIYWSERTKDVSKYLLEEKTRLENGSKEEIGRASCRERGWSRGGAGEIGTRREAGEM